MFIFEVFNKDNQPVYQTHYQFMIPPRDNLEEVKNMGYTFKVHGVEGSVDDAVALQDPHTYHSIKLVESEGILKTEYVTPPGYSTAPLPVADDEPPKPVIVPSKTYGKRAHPKSKSLFKL